MSVGDVHPSAEEEEEAVRSWRASLTPKERQAQDSSDAAEEEARQRSLALHRFGPVLDRALRRTEALRRLDLELAIRRRLENRG